MVQSAAHDDFLYKDEVFRIRGAIFAVYRSMGAGFLEAVYQECLAIEFSRQGIEFEVQKPVRLTYQGHPLRQTYVADFVCYGRIILEIKALRAIAPEHRAQVINYVRATDLKLGLLANFDATPRAEIERFALSRSATSALSAVSSI